MSRQYSPAESAEYTRWLATNHYENFHVVTFLLPRSLHRDFYNVYAFCRWADDLGDEIPDRDESLEWLAWWRGELAGMYEGRADHPVFVALRETVERHEIPREPFDELIQAFVQDQHVSRYRDLDELYAYCRCSANPVGRLVLYMCGYRDQERQRLSDRTCTALQLANFWQDVSRDWDKGRVYIPLEVLAQHGSSVDDIRDRRATPGFRAALKAVVGLTRELFLQGLPLARMVDRRLAVDLELFSRGGMLVLEKIEDLDFDVLARRPAISRVERAWLLTTALLRTVGRRAG
jgi:squalene synthase HpnC